MSHTERHRKLGPGDGAAWWATLEHAALRDETRVQARRERWVVVAWLVAGTVTALVLVLHGAPR